jgi:hypothetical protein
MICLTIKINFMTSIEWLASQLGEHIIWEEKIIDLIEQAKEMHKHEIIDAWNSAGGGDAYHQGKDYYQETFVSGISEKPDNHTNSEIPNHIVAEIGSRQEITENTSDGYHTFKELYEFRKVYNAALFNEWHKQSKYWVHKSWRHHDGELCFGGGWFIVVAVLPGGQISNHYEANDWDLFQVKEVQKAIFEFDGHTGQNVIERIKEICK